MDSSIGYEAVKGWLKITLILGIFAILGIWKLVEIIIWLVNHVKIG